MTLGVRRRLDVPLGRLGFGGLGEGGSGETEEQDGDR
jgi:hypothetical protein